MSSTSTIDSKIKSALASFRFNSFREGQEQVIKSLLVDGGGNALAVFPTGSGKSLCYQLPASILAKESDGLTIVVSPLISLMKDQVDALRKLNIIEVDSTGSFQTDEERRKTRENLQNKTTKMLYCAPEQLQNEITRNILETRTIELFVIDESHAISEWGSSFRPSYLRVAHFATEIFKAKRILALTATATEKVCNDICTGFNIPKQNYVRTTFYRKNLILRHHVAMSLADQRQTLLDLLSQRRVNGPTIIYATTQKCTEEVTAFLCTNGYPQAKCYHAGLNSETRTKTQDEFMDKNNNNGIIVGTIAFGMGLDKHNVRRVIHFNMSKSLEGYSQEIGRAGRDGKDSYCDTILNFDDTVLLETFAACDSVSATNIYMFLTNFFDPAHCFVGGIRPIAVYSTAREYDMSQTMLEMLLAWLEIKHDCIEVKTPIYDEHKLQFKDDKTGARIRTLRQSLRTTDAKVTEAIKTALTVKVSWAYVSVDAACDNFKARMTPAERAVYGGNTQQLNHEVREKIAKGLIDIEQLCSVIVISSGVKQRYLVKKVPSDAELRRMAGVEYSRVRQRESDDLDRIRDVLSLITANHCQANHLSRHFGEILDRNWKCGNCTWCSQGQPIALPNGHSLATSRANMSVIPQEKWWKVIAVAEQYPELKLHPRTLARFAFGSRSPLISKLRIGNLNEFGCLEKIASWEAVLAACETFCGRRDDVIY